MQYGPNIVIVTALFQQTLLSWSQVSLSLPSRLLSAAKQPNTLIWLLKQSYVDDVCFSDLICPANICCLNSEGLHLNVVMVLA